MTRYGRRQLKKYKRLQLKNPEARFVIELEPGAYLGSDSRRQMIVADVKDAIGSTNSYIARQRLGKYEKRHKVKFPNAVIFESLIFGCQKIIRTTRRMKYSVNYKYLEGVRQLPDGVINYFDAGYDIPEAIEAKVSRVVYKIAEQIRKHRPREADGYPVESVETVVTSLDGNDGRRTRGTLVKFN